MKIVSSYSFEQKKQIDGGQGRNSRGVWLARDPQLGGEVAVKMIEKSRFPDSASYFDEAKRMFAAEHPSVVPIRVACETRDDICLVMPYFSNGSLSERITDSPLSIREVLRYGQDILAGVGAIHASRSVHLDIKPSNILFDDRGTPLIADFGQARRMSGTGFAPLPDRVYMPHLPAECFTANAAGPQADVYQVGLTLYRCINGDSSFQEQLRRFSVVADLTAAVIAGAFPDKQAYLPHVPRGLKTVINKALSPNIGKRLQSAADFANALGQVTAKHDWRPQICANGDVEWTAARSAKPDLLVELRQDPRRKWSVEVFTRNPSGRRRTRMPLHSHGMTRNAAMQHLRQAFRGLERA